MFVLFIGNTGGSFVPSRKRGISGKNPWTCDKNRPVVTGLLNVVFTPSFNNCFILSNCFMRRSYSCRKSFPISKRSISREDFMAIFSTGKKSLLPFKRPGKVKVGAKFRTIYVKL